MLAIDKEIMMFFSWDARCQVSSVVRRVAGNLKGGRTVITHFVDPFYPCFYQLLYLKTNFMGGGGIPPMPPPLVTRHLVVHCACKILTVHVHLSSYMHRVHFGKIEQTTSRYGLDKRSREV